MKIVWDENGWEDYLYWQAQDKKTLKRINMIIKKLARNDGKTLAKSEKLKGDLSGLSSCRIDQKNRLVFKIKDNQLIVVQCKGHYQEK